MQKHFAFTLVTLLLAASLFAADVFASPAGYDGSSEDVEVKGKGLMKTYFME